MSHRITKGKGTLEYRLDGKCLSLILEDVSDCIKKSFDFSNNRTYILKQLTQIKYNLQRRHKRMVRHLIGYGFQNQQEKAHLNLEKFYELIGKDRSITPSTSQIPNLELTLGSSQQDQQPMQPDDLESWIDDLLYCSENIDDIIGISEKTTPPKDLIEIEIEQWIEDFIK